MDLSLLFIKAIIFGMVFMGVAFFLLRRYLFKTTEGAVTRLNKETEVVRSKQTELNTKIKQAQEELVKRRAEADALVAKMKTAAEEKAKEEREKILAKSRQEGEEIIAKAQNTKDEIRKVLEKEMEMKATDFTVMILNEIFSDKVKNVFDGTLVNEFLDSLEKVDMAMISEDVDTADVLTAIPLSTELSQRLSGILKKKLNREINLNASVDKKIISGIILRFGTLSLNGSLQNMIKETGLGIKEKLEKGLL